MASLGASIDSSATSPTISPRMWSHNTSGIKVYHYEPFSRSDLHDSSDMYFKEPDPYALVNHETIPEIAERLANTPAVSQWIKIGVRHHTGVCVPVFSLRSDRNGSCGVGEYLDLLPLIDWCLVNGFDVIQMLPINDTNPIDNSPFSPVSSFSLNPKLLSLRKLPGFDQQSEAMKGIISDLCELNKESRVQWNKVSELKRRWLWDYFCMEDQQELLLSPEYTDFVDRNRFWVEGYGLFCLLKNKHEWTHWKDWEETAMIPDDFDPNEDSVLELPFAMKYLHEEDRKELNFHIFLQFLCYQQMIQVKQYADSKKVFLKGDIPFLVSADSVDVWLNRPLFDLEKTAGAPPDAFNTEGQNWGVPIYNWSNMRMKNFTWWKQRLEIASQYFHIYRVDHIIGFYRVWAIPSGKPGTEGKFEPLQPADYIAQGEEILLELLECCDMLPIGEDLGVVPPEVRRSLQTLGICGTKVLRWERKWDQPGHPFIPLEDFNSDSMTTLSTHDSETLTQWWNKNDQEVDLFCDISQCSPKTREEPELSKSQREHILMQSHSTPSLFHINLIQEYLALDPALVHPDPDLERINIPGQVLESNWSYRLACSFEEMATNTALAESLGRICSINGRKRRSFSLRSSRSD